VKRDDPPAAPPDERKLLSRHLGGDAYAFADLVSLLRAEIYTYLVRSGFDPSVRDDLFQEIFLTIHRNASKYDSSYPLRPWVFTIVVNTVRTHLRKVKASKLVYEAQTADRRAEQDSAEDFQIAAETRAWIEEELKKLPAEQREVMLLCCIKGLEQKDVAHAAKMPVNTVKTHLRRARIALTKSLMLRRAKIKCEVL